MLIPDHGCTESWPEGVTYLISANDAIDISVRDFVFADKMRSGKYRYMEGHFCLNSPKYLECDCYRKIHLTLNARRHIAECWCCLSFQASGRYRNTCYQIGKVARTKTTSVTDKYRPGYDLVAEPGIDSYVKENTVFSDDSWLWDDFLYEMSDNYKEAILDIMKKKGITQEILANDMNVDRKMVYKCLNAENPSKPHLVAICVALKLPSFISE